MTEKQPDPRQLTRRERQIMDVLYRREEATAATVLERLPDPPSYSAVRALLAKLETKGHVDHRADGPRYVYRPTVPRGKARHTAMKRLVDTFFDGSVAHAVSGLIDLSGDRLDDAELSRLEAAIERARTAEGAGEEERA